MFLFLFFFFLFFLRKKKMNRKKSNDRCTNCNAQRAVSVLGQRVQNKFLYLPQSHTFCCCCIGKGKCFFEVLTFFPKYHLKTAFLVPANGSRGFRSKLRQYFVNVIEMYIFESCFALRWGCNKGMGPAIHCCLHTSLSGSSWVVRVHPLHVKCLIFFIVASTWCS